MNVSTAEVLTENTKENFFVPKIISTTPVQSTKEIDLTFVQFTQRKRAALDYIASVEARREDKANCKANKIAKFKSVITDTLGGIFAAALIFVILLIGTIL